MILHRLSFVQHRRSFLATASVQESVIRVVQVCAAAWYSSYKCHLFKRVRTLIAEGLTSH